MKVVVPPNDALRVIENVFIPMRDGARLAARIWMPPGAERHPVPAIMEYIPYRKRDLSRGRDTVNHPYMAAHGYACIRVDMRGSGDSDGVLTDEYTPQEQEDAVEVIAWLTEQPWCDGNVGMMGISWGGFNSLQVAARQPPALKAIISVCSSDDLYADNMHYMGGCLLGDNLSEATVMFAFNSLPPDPEIVGDRWRDMWHERLQRSGLWLDPWLSHQRRSDYWRRGSVCENYAAIQCPVFAVGGWTDGFTNAVFRLLEHLDVPRLGLIGPWGHKYPHLGIPGPAIGFLQEALRWWDHWLKGRDTGIMREPMLRAWMQDYAPPNYSYEERPGHWVGERQWPATGIETWRLPFAPHHLSFSPNETRRGAIESVRSPLSVGMFAGKWCSYTAAPDLPGDQREEDGGSLVYQSRPLAKPLAILGQPRLELRVSSDKPLAMIAARLSDVAPDGRATRVTYGVLNLAHRNGSADPQRLEPHREYDVELPLNGIGQTFRAGHRLRISLSTSYWPLVWPMPEPATLWIDTRGSTLLLPVREPQSDDATQVAFAPPEGAPPLAIERLRRGDHNWRLVRDLAGEESTLEVVNDEPDYRIVETGTEVARCTREWYTFNSDDFASPRGETQTERLFRRGDWNVRISTCTVLSCSATEFNIHAQLDAYEDDQRVYAQNWNRTIPRDHL